MRLTLLALDEVRRTLVSRRGALSVLAFALLWAVVLVYLVRPAGALDAGSAAGAAGGAGALARAAAERFELEALLAWPSAQLAAGWVAALYLLPVVVLAAAVDQIASDRARGTLRYLALRASRTEMVLGRWLGQAAVQAALVAAALGSTLAAVGLDAPERLGESLAAAAPAGLALWLSLLPWVALAALVSVLAPSARRATLLALGAWLALSWAASAGRGWLVPDGGTGEGWRAAAAGALETLVPGAAAGALLRATPADAPLAALPALAQAALFVALAALAFRRRSL